LPNPKFKNYILPVILSGGSGTRLWPLSRSSFPKQYLNLEHNTTNTLLQSTILRLSGLKDLYEPLIICNEEQRFIVAEQLREIDCKPFSIILEPFGRNTAPAIALAAIASKIEKINPILLILSSDNKITNKESFQESIKLGLPFAEKGNIVTFGIEPTSPETGFGYIEAKDIIEKNNKSSSIIKFIEKPNQEIANKLVKDKHFTWNSGIFLVKASSIIKELNKFEPNIVNLCEKSLKKNSKDFYFRRIDKEEFKKCPNISIDNAVMENTDLGIVISLNAGWNDLGSWKSVWEDAELDENNNTIQGRTYTKEISNTYIMSESRLIVGLGLKDILIVDTHDALLVAQKDSISSLKDLVKEMDAQNIDEIKLNKKVHRPWGNFTSVIKEKTWQVKRLEINPKSSLSLQLHHKRAEHWIVVKNTAKVEINGKISFLKENESIYVPLGSKHRLSNPGDETLILIEVQSGTYLGEDDIVRFKDNYNRN
tara:strand:+ start:3623 stop:5068 length:1446 start_codon:yes stop_codon:yes gene_type:complete